MLGLDHLSNKLVSATAACNVITTPPPPMDDDSVSDPLECPSLRWGLIGCGRVCHDFTQSLKNLPTATVVACAARKIESAKAFAERHGIEKYCKFSSNKLIGLLRWLRSSFLFFLLYPFFFIPVGRWWLRRSSS